MNITHVIRAEEHLANTLKQLLVFDALQWSPPAFAHVPLVLAADRTKLSKRHGATSVGQFAESGILPEALFAYLMKAGDRKVLPSTQSIIYEFGLDKIGRKGAIFDEQQLVALNRRFLENMDTWRFKKYVADVEEKIDEQNFTTLQNETIITQSVKNEKPWKHDTKI